MLGGRYTYEQRTMAVMRWVSLVLPVFIALYSLAVEFGYVHSDVYAGLPAAMWLIVIWIVTGVVGYLFPPHTKLTTSAYLILQHVLTIIFVYCIAGINTSLVAAWVVLYLASYIYFSYLGFFLSFVAFVTTLSGEAVATGANRYALSQIVVAAVTTTCIGGVAILLNRIREYDREEIAESKLGADIQKERMLTLVNNLADAIVSTDSRGYIQIYNAAFASLVDTNVSVFNRSIDAIVPLKDSEDHDIQMSELLQRSSSLNITDDYSIIVAGERLRLEITYTPIRSTYNRDPDDQEGDGYLIIFRDVTKAKSLEEERDEFISVVSHELRTPIAVTEGSIDNAKVIFEKDPSKTNIVAKSLATAHEQVLFLSRMVNDLSTLSRAERGIADAAEDIDIKAMAHELYGEYAPQAEKKGLRLELELGQKVGHVFASRLYLHELLQNFVTNSIKYTKEGRITLSITESAGVVHFAVSDTGIGISKTDQKKIFQKFYRSEDYRTRETGGTGLGLYVAAKLSKKLGTSIEVQSRLNHGSTFSFSLPSTKDTA